MSQIIPPPLREDLKVGRLVQQGELSFVIKEPDKQEYYHFNDAQYELMQLFDGTRDLERICRDYNRRSSEYEFDLEDVSDLYESCREFQLLKRTKKEQNAALFEKIREERKKKLLQGQGSLLFLRFQLVDPNDFFDKIIDKIRFFWHPTAIKIQAATMVVAFLAVLFQGERFFDDFSRVYLSAQHGSLGIFSIWLVALGAIAVHECGHGLTCKHYGGDVHEMGFLLLAFQPCLYCNVNDAWLFEDKWQKIYVALAGIWVELQLAALGAFVWLMVDVGNPIGFVAFVLLTIGTFTSVMVNLNPLLKFDGYYILTDVLEMQNLRQNAIAWMSYTLKTKVLRLKEEAPFTPSKREKRIYLIYGGLVTVYMIAILSFIAIIGYEFVSAQFGFLANIAFIYLVFFLVRKLTGTWGETLSHWTKSVFWSNSKRQKITSIGLVILVAIMIFWQPPIRIHSSGSVDAPTHIVYASESGFVSQAAFGDDRQVTAQAGEPIITLISPELNLQKVQLQNSKNLLQMRQLEAQVASDAATSRRLAIEDSLISEQLDSVENQNRSLVIPMPEGDWEVDGMPVQSLMGRYFGSGSPVINLVSASERFVEVIVDQRDVLLLESGNKGLIRFAGVAPKIYDAQIDMISPVAKLDGIEQSLLVRMKITLSDDAQIPPLGLSGDIVIFGQPQPLWRHIFHSIRKVLRADLWL